MIYNNNNNTTLDKKTFDKGINRYRKMHRIFMKEICLQEPIQEPLQFLLRDSIYRVTHEFHAGSQILNEVSFRY